MEGIRRVKPAVHGEDALFFYFREPELLNSSSQKDHTRFQRLRFVVLNQDNLKKDITIGDGEYLRAYFVSRQSKQRFDNYQIFIGHVSQQAPLLISLFDPVDFYDCLENI